MEKNNNGAATWRWEDIFASFVAKISSVAGRPVAFGRAQKKNRKCRHAFTEPNGKASHARKRNAWARATAA